MFNKLEEKVMYVVSEEVTLKPLAMFATVDEAVTYVQAKGLMGKADIRTANGETLSGGATHA